MRWNSLACVRTLVFLWGYLNTLNSSWLLPTNWNDWKFLAQECQACHCLCLSFRFVQFWNNQSWNNVKFKIISSIISRSARWRLLMDSPTGTHPCISEAIPFISLWAPVGVSAVPEISGVPQKSDFRGDKTHREATWPTKKVFLYLLTQSIIFCIEKWPPKA